MMREETTNGVFVKVLASELGMEDEFLQHQPQTNEERVLKQEIETAIRSSLKDFYRPRYDPSFDADGRICYVPGKKPAVNKSYNWWEENAKKYAPECGSRLGTKTEYIAFMAVLIKELVASGWTVEKAWHAVCNDSKKLGHYKNSNNAKYYLEYTGSREICGFCDLANTYKLLAKDNEAGGFWTADGFWAADGFWIAGGNCFVFSYAYPLPNLCYEYNRYNHDYGTTGWLVLEAGSTDH